MRGLNSSLCGFWGRYVCGIPHLHVFGVLVVHLQRLSAFSEVLQVVEEMMRMSHAARAEERGDFEAFDIASQVAHDLVQHMVNVNGVLKTHVVGARYTALHAYIASHCRDVTNDESQNVRSDGRFVLANVRRCECQREAGRSNGTGCEIANIDHTAETRMVEDFAAKHKRKIMLTGPVTAAEALILTARRDQRLAAALRSSEARGGGVLLDRCTCDL